MTNYMIGKVLQGRYQIVQSLGTGVFGQTYIAVDIETPENSKCVVKQIKVTSSHPAYLQNLRLHFLSESKTLEYLGHHEQIPQLLACFEEDERFYLVQEFIDGHALTAELPTKKNVELPTEENTEYLWTENEVVGFLLDVLGILKFVHSQGVIHCDVKPENLIRRTHDGKLVLIDFGSIQPVDFTSDEVLPIYKIPVTSLGYIPPEQFIGQTQPNSDIYALGMIAIQALTGLTPLQLKVEPHSNQIIWRSSNTPVSDYVAAILTQMVSYDAKERFQSATEVIQALQEMPLENEALQTIEANYIEFAEPSEEIPHPDELGSKSPLLTGMKVGLAANSLVVGFGVYSLLSNAPAYSETQTLYQATEEFQSGDLEGAIALAKSIPRTSNVYPDAQTTIEDWQNQWQAAAEQYQVAEKAFHENRWTDVLHAAAQVPDILYWQSKIDHLVKHAQVSIEIRTKDLLAKAYEKAADRDFSAALDYLHQVPQESSANKMVQQKIAEYNEKQRVRATYYLQKAYNTAADGDFDNAVAYLQEVPKNTPVYEAAQLKLIEYSYKQRLAEDPKIASSQILNSGQKKVGQSINKSSALSSIKSFDPTDDLQEVNIR
jgi:tetratricopeptide (TPR) repeat protein